MKRKHSIGLAILAVAASSLAACGKTKLPAGTVIFWSSFGTGYTNALNPIVDEASTDTGVPIDHQDHKSYDRILEDFISSFTDRSYPNIGMGYPDHFAKYLSKGILVPLNDYITEDIEKDYYTQYMDENHFYDDGRQNAKDQIYALPFNKSTELLGYNGVFVDYCTQVQESYGFSGLENIPATWADWKVRGPQYNTIYKDLLMHWTVKDGERTSSPGKKVYGVQDTEGKATGLVALDAKATAPEGKKLLLDFEKVDPEQSLLMSWDATDNAFITLTRQWGAEYTKVPETEKTKKASKRQGHIWFNSSVNQPLVVDMLRFFNKLNKDRIFGTPSDLGGTYSSDAFANGGVMFMICSSGGLSYNTAKWTNRFRVAPIPYKDASMKRVISQGANICMTDQGNSEASFKVIRALTSGKLQTKWCLETGYYPCSRSAYESQEYQDFLTEAERLPAEEAYAFPTRVAYREGSEINSNYYMNESQGWLKFVDPAFDGSSDLRKAVKGVFAKIFGEVAADAQDSAYTEHLNVLMNKDVNPDINGSTFVWEK